MVDRCYVRMFENFQRKFTNLMNESFTLRNRLLQDGKRMFKRDSNVPHHSGSMEKKKKKMSIKYG